ncbi:MAG TPA: LamG-like jellyroll fold domain-containing protein, partial [Chitinophagaceae bacterium]|nr:LamG-like jellyroll fold domain-containing protein [Chitinophagaceae bacterium]
MSTGSPISNLSGEGAKVLSSGNWLSTLTLGSKVTVGDLDVTGNQITVEAMVNRTGALANPVSYGHVVSKHTTPTDVNYALLPNGCELTTTTTGYHNITVCYPDFNKPYHIAMTYDGAALKFYRDGYLMATTPCTGNMVNNDWLTTISQIADGANPAISQFLGYVNEVRIWNVARTQAELITYMNTPLPNPASQPGLLAYYTFDDLSNKQGNTLWNGSLSGGAVLNQTNTNCNFIRDSCAVKVGCPNWLSLPTQGSKSVIGDLDISGNQMTVEATFNRTQALNSGLYYGSLVSKHTTTTDVNYSLLPNGCEITTSVSGYKAIFQACPIQLNVTYHVAMVYDGANLKFYRNGVLISFTPCTGNIV